ncbi:hypothetical protein [Candidatus Methanomethylophilus sp. 1R26]|uniref:hypothetical protein n=1 Tax=Candidatus Methanomethylophilus sp. 1R26 TaxID=1769296 RepID=UPI001910D938|nr:hypothetical protein [Candidatus Methanomethylophilus sp. 1R26]
MTLSPSRIVPKDWLGALKSRRQSNIITGASSDTDTESFTGMSSPSKRQQISLLIMSSRYTRFSLSKAARISL